MALPNDLEVSTLDIGGSQGACIVNEEGKIVPKPKDDDKE
jgi:hypothetical protein